jgi:hypothetical protein
LIGTSVDIFIVPNINFCHLLNLTWQWDQCFVPDIKKRVLFEFAEIWYGIIRGTVIWNPWHFKYGSNIVKCLFSSQKKALFYWLFNYLSWFIAVIQRISCLAWQFCKNIDIFNLEVKCSAFKDCQLLLLLYKCNMYYLEVILPSFEEEIHIVYLVYSINLYILMVCK